MSYQDIWLVDMHKQSRGVPTFGLTKIVLINIIIVINGGSGGC